MSEDVGQEVSQEDEQSQVETTQETNETQPTSSEEVVKPEIKEEKTPRRNDEPHTVFVGDKPFMNYVTGVVMQFTTQGAEEVTLKARGKYISRAVDIAEVAAKRFLENSVDVKNIAIDSEDFENREGRQVRVSTIEVVLARKE